MFQTSTASSCSEYFGSLRWKMPACDLVGVDHERRARPEADRVAVGSRVRVGCWRMRAPVRVDAAHVVHRLGEEIRLPGRHDELAQERDREPARKPRRAAIAERVVFDPLRRQLAPMLQIRERVGLQLRGRELVTLLRGVEQRRADTLPKAAPVRHVVERQRRAAARLRLQRRVELDAALVREAQSDLRVPICRNESGALTRSGSGRAGRRVACAGRARRAGGERRERGHGRDAAGSQRRPSDPASAASAHRSQRLVAGVGGDGVALSNVKSRNCDEPVSVWITSLF